MCMLHKRKPVGIKACTGIHLNKSAIFALQMKNAALTPNIPGSAFSSVLN